MNTDKILQDLSSRFSASLPEFYKRRIIFWYDEDREFEDWIADLSIPDVRVVVLNGSNLFAVKKLLTVDDTTHNYLVYSPVRYEKPEDDWLLNIELYSEDFRADRISLWMEEMDLPANPAMRQMVHAYRKFFGNASRRSAIASMAKDIQNASGLHLAVMAFLSGLKNPQPSAIIRSVLACSLDMEQNAIYQKFEEYGAAKPFWIMAYQATGYSADENASLKQLAIHLLLTTVTRTLHPDHLAGLSGHISMPHQAYCYDIVSEWLAADAGSLYHVARFAEGVLRLPERFCKLNMDDLLDTECFPCINECVLKMLMTQISDSIIQPETIRRVVEKRRTLVWYSHFSCYYEGLLEVAKMQIFFESHAAGFHLATAREVWEAYATDYYQMDAAYRRFHFWFGQSLNQMSGDLDDLMKLVAEKVEVLYNGWFLANLSDNWTNVCEDELAKFGRVMEVPQQESFYSNKVTSNASRVYVIVSDALRYEVAAELAGQLRQEMQCNVELSTMQAMFPTITKFGMAALLPHQELNVVQKSGGEVTVLADGASTAMPDRDKILKSARIASVALQYKNLIKMKRAERQALVKGMDVVYIYHDRIDEASHTSDSQVFPACEEAITEIKAMIRMICNEFSGAHIMITADHGFLYTYSPLREDNKLDKSSFHGSDAELGRRYAILRDGAGAESMMYVRWNCNASGLAAYSPRENIRIKTGGGGLNYVHGGASLQEMVVPLIDYQNLRNDYKSYQHNKKKYDTKPVGLTILSSSRKISNLIFSLNFFQTEAVSDNRSACNYQVYFVDAEGNKISDTNRIIADKASANGQERTFRCGFTLKNMKYSKRESYYLIIADESGLQAPAKEEFTIDIALSFEEFNFF